MYVCIECYTYVFIVCAYSCVHVCQAVPGISEAQRVDQTSHNKQRTSVGERDPTGQTTGLQKGYIVLFLMSVCLGAGICL